MRMGAVPGAPSSRAPGDDFGSPSKSARRNQEVFPVVPGARSPYPSRAVRRKKKSHPPPAPPTQKEKPSLPCRQAQKEDLPRRQAQEADCPYPSIFFACACTQVMAMTPTMSSAVQPRDRSFTGAAMPWVIGPYASAFARRCTSL